MRIVVLGALLFGGCAWGHQNTHFKGGNYQPPSQGPSAGQRVAVGMAALQPAPGRTVSCRTSRYGDTLYTSCD